MGTVKYTGPVASFHCPTEATIRSLKVHFSPKQEGSGDPSPENVRPIVGWDGCEGYCCRKNIGKIRGYSASSLQSNNGTRQLTNNYGTVLNTVDYNLPDTSLVITQNQAPETTTKSSYKNGYVCIVLDNLIFDETYKISFKITNIINNPLNAALTSLRGLSPYGNMVMPEVINDNIVCFTLPLREDRNSNYKAFELRICGMSFTMSEFMVTTVDVEDRTFEPYHGSTTDYEFGVLGKNKFNWNVPASESSPGSDPSTAREFTLGTYVIGMSVNNYYRQNYANWVLNPSVSNGTISFSSNAASGYGIAFPMKLTVSQTYFLSGTGNGVAGATYYDKDGNVISYQNNRLNNTIIIPENTVTTLIGFYANTKQTDFTFSNIQLELGSTATAYEPYDPNKTVYGGWVDLISGELMEEGIDNYPYEFISLNGTENWTIVKQNEQSTIFKYNYGIGAKSEGKSICSHFVLRLSSYTQLDIPNAFVHGMSGNLFIQTDNTLASTIEEFTNYLQEQYQNNTPVSVLFQANRVNKTYNLPPHSTELKTFLSANNIWSNADYVEVEYDLHETQTILARKQFIVANQPHIVKPAAAPLQNFVTDMAAPLKECKIFFTPVQEGEGDPSPDNVRPITGWTGVEVYKAGKNLCPAATSAEMYENWEYYESGRNYIIHGLPAGQAMTLQTNVLVDRGENISNLRLYLRGADYGFINTATPSGVGTLTRHVADNGTIRISHNNLGLSPTSYNVQLADTQLEVGSTAIAYEPYQGQTIPIDWSSAGTVYGGYVDLVSGEVWETHHKQVADGISLKCNSSYMTDTIIAAGIVYLNPVGLYSGVSTPNVLADAIPMYTQNYERDHELELPYATCTNAGNQYIIFKVANRAEHPEVTDANTCKNFVNTWLQEHPVTLVYELRTPTLITTLTPTALRTLIGTNNIWANNNGSNVQIKFWTH